MHAHTIKNFLDLNGIENRIIHLTGADYQCEVNGQPCTTLRTASALVAERQKMAEAGHMIARMHADQRAEQGGDFAQVRRILGL